MEVYKEECFCPLLKEIRFQPCINPPTADYLLEKIVKLIEEKGEYNCDL